MEQFPEAGYGLCSLPQNKVSIYPFELSPEETYKMNFFEMELFHKAPLSAIIKRDAFISVGGFTGKPFLGDFEFWQILSQRYSVVLMPEGIVWYRTHSSQESKRMAVNPMNNFMYLVVGKELINSLKCPLRKEDQQRVLKEYEKKQAKAILSAVKHHSIKKALEMKDASQLSMRKILKRILAK
ncbi:hypothetical protein GCM10028791_39030 [Echinicola sediminis]